MKIKNIIMVLQIINIYIYSQVISPPAPSKYTNQTLQGQFKNNLGSKNNVNSKNYIDGNISISDFDGNLSVFHKREIKEVGQLTLNLDLTFNANCSHTIFRGHVNSVKPRDVNAPAWIFGVGGIAIQTTNFEKNWNISTRNDNIITDRLLSGDYIPMLIKGYHYSNTLQIDSRKDAIKRDIITILKSDGSTIDLINPIFGKRNVDDTKLWWSEADDENSKIGTYVEIGEANKGYALVEWVEKNTPNWWERLRRVNYKPGNGLTYCFEEEIAQYQNINTELDWSGHTLRAPRILYLRKIYNTNGDELSFNYSDILFDDNHNVHVQNGRKRLKNIKYKNKNINTEKEVIVFSIYPSYDIFENNIVVTINDNKYKHYLWRPGSYPLLNSNDRNGYDTYSGIFLIKEIENMNAITHSISYSYKKLNDRKYVYTLWNHDLLKNFIFYKINFPNYAVSSIHKGSYYPQNFMNKFDYYETSMNGNNYDTNFHIPLGEQNWDPFDPGSRLFHIFLFHFNLDNMSACGRDNYSKNIIKKSSLYSVNGTNSKLIKSDSYSYGWDHYIQKMVGNGKEISYNKLYLPWYDRYYDLKTSITTTGFVPEKGSAPLSIIQEKYYDLIRYYTGGQFDCIDNYNDVIDYKESQIKLMKEKKYSPNQNKEYLTEYNYDIGILNQYAYSGGTYNILSIKKSIFEFDTNLMQSKVEYIKDPNPLEFSIGEYPNKTFKKKFYKWEETREYNKPKWENGKVVYLNQKSLKKDFKHYYPTTTQDFSDVNQIYMINLPENVVNSVNNIGISHKKIEYYDNITFLLGKPKKTISYGKTSSLRNKNIVNFEYYTEPDIYQGYLKKTFDDKGLINEYFYLNKTENSFRAKAHYEDGSSNLDFQYTSEREFQLEPFKITTTNGNHSSTIYKIYDKFGNLTYYVDKNGFLHNYEYDNFNRLKYVYLPGNLWKDSFNSSNLQRGTISYKYDRFFIPDININTKLNLLDNKTITIKKKSRFDFEKIAFIDEYISDNSVKENLNYLNYLGLSQYVINSEANQQSNHYNFENKILKTNYFIDTNIISKIYKYETNNFNKTNYDITWFEKVKIKDEELKQIKDIYYDAEGNVIKEEITGINTPLKYVYNNTNQLEKVISRENKVLEYAYDDLGNISERTSKDFGKYQYLYDNKDRLRFYMSKTTQPYDVIFNRYDALDRIIAKGTFEGNQKIFDNDELNPDHIYNANFNGINSFENLNSNIDNFLVVNHYDNYIKNGVFSNMVDPVSPQIIQGMNLEGKKVMTAFRDNKYSKWNFKIYGYDKWGNISNFWIKFEEEPWIHIIYRYNSTGQLLQIEVDNMFLSYDYDNQGRISKVWTNKRNDKNSSKLEAVYSYNSLGQIKRIGPHIQSKILKDLTITDVKYETSVLIVAEDIHVLGTSGAALNLTAGNCITLRPGFKVSKGGKFTAKIDPTLAEETLAYGTIDYQYNNRGWVSKIDSKSKSGRELFKEILTYEKNGNIKTQTIKNVGNGNWNDLTFSFAYDELYRLLSSNCNHPYHSQTFNYDKDGNFISKSINGFNYNYDYFSGSNKLKSINGKYNYIYDSKGNLIMKKNNRGNNIFEVNKYDYRNLPLTVRDITYNTTKYKYDNLGKRIYKQNGIIRDLYIIDEMSGNEIAVFNLNNGKFKQFNIIGNDLIGFIKRNNSGVDERFYFIKDHLGNIRVTVDKNNEIVNSKDYYAFGKTLREINNGTEQKYDYTSKELDKETGLHYFGARYYDSNISNRWLSVDPLADKYPGWSPYNYALNNPINKFDPDGKYVVSANGQTVSRVTLARNTWNSITSYINPFYSAGEKLVVGDPSWKLTTADYSGMALSGIMKTTFKIVGKLMDNSATKFANEINQTFNVTENLVNSLFSTGVDIMTSQQVENNLLVDKEVFNIAVKTGLGTYSTASNAGKLTINPTLKLGRDEVIKSLEEIKKMINKFLNGRMINELNDYELESLRNSFK